MTFHLCNIVTFCESNNFSMEKVLVSHIAVLFLIFLHIFYTPLASLTVYFN